MENVNFQEFILHLKNQGFINFTNFINFIGTWGIFLKISL